MRALILAGGSGTRFWPLSRRHRPKQLLALDGERSLLQASVDRLAPSVASEDVWICTTERLADAVRGQLPEVPPAQVLAEPEGRDTAPAIGWALRSMPESARDEVVAVLPADHRVGRPEAFRACLERAAEEARDHARVVTLGVRPRWPETGYGYLELEQPLDAIDDPQAPRRVARFREKPDLETARIYVDGGRHLWNAGIFVFRGGVLLDHLRRLVPELAGGLDAIVERPEDAAGLYADLPKISIDYAVMERLDDLATVPLDADWTDLGSWAALADLLEDEADGDGNRGRGDTLTLDARDNLLWADSGTVAVVGVEGLAVVRTDDAVLVMPRERSQDVKALIDALRASGRDTLL